MCAVLCAESFHSAVKGKITQNCLVSIVQNANLLTQVFKYREAFFELALNMWKKRLLSGKGCRGKK